MPGFLKDPDAVLDYAFDWSAWLAAENDTIATVEWEVPAGITQETDPAPSNTDTTATVWLSGGTDGQNYLVTCRITTAAGRVDDRTMRISVRSR